METEGSATHAALLQNNTALEKHYIFCLMFNQIHTVTVFILGRLSVSELRRAESTVETKVIIFAQVGCSVLRPSSQRSVPAEMNTGGLIY